MFQIFTIPRCSNYLLNHLNHLPKVVKTCSQLTIPRCSMGREYLPSHFPLNVAIFHQLDTPPKTNMTGWKIPMFNRIHTSSFMVDVPASHVVFLGSKLKTYCFCTYPPMKQRNIANWKIGWILKTERIIVPSIHFQPPKASPKVGSFLHLAWASTSASSSSQVPWERWAVGQLGQAQSKNSGYTPED